MNNFPIEASYPISFRFEDAKKLGQLIAQRRSVNIVGMKRVGISNFLRFFLTHEEISSKYLNSQSHVFIPVDLNDLVERELFPFWTLTLKRIVDVVEVKISDEEVKRKVAQLFLDSIQSQDIFLTIDSIKKSLTYIIDAGFMPTIFFIRFDRIIDAATPTFFANLQGLIDATHRKMSYVFTSARTLDTLSPDVFTKQAFSVVADTLYLKPAEKEDVKIILDAFCKQNNFPLDENSQVELLKLVDGYIQYLQFALIVIQEIEALPPPETLFTLLLSDERIGLQSEELWESLTTNEKKVLEKIVLEGKISDSDLKEAEYLSDSGIIKNKKVFSPIFEEFIKSKMNKKDGALPELSKKEHLLLTFLEKHRNEICEREEIISHVWPEAEAVGVSDWAIDRLVSRLRNKLKNQNSEVEIITVKTRGYKLV